MPNERARDLRQNLTDAERKLWQALRRNQLEGHSFRRQHPIKPFIVDFICLEKHLIIEVDGGQHADNAEADAKRTATLNECGYRVVRYWNNDVLKNIEGICEQILLELKKSEAP